jgi:hypothetical protein
VSQNRDLRIPDHQQGIRCKSKIPDFEGGAEERRLTAKERHLREAYWPIRRKPFESLKVLREERSKSTRLELREIPTRREDDALMVDQEKPSWLDTIAQLAYISSVRERFLSLTVDTGYGMELTGVIFEKSKK